MAPSPSNHTWEERAWESVPWLCAGIMAVSMLVAILPKPARVPRPMPSRFTNGLGVPFVYVPGSGVFFSIWPTRVQDFARFVEETKRDMGTGMFCLDAKPDSANDTRWRWMDHTWRDPGFAQTNDHPVVGVNHEDADAFCTWLTRRDRIAGLIKENARYRLPTDEEWSVAVGATKYPWGDQWPPPANAGNYAGEEFDLVWIQIKGYRDSYVRTSPVGHFSPNAYGLYDMSGNVWQWCSDWYTKSMNTEASRKAEPLLENDGGGKAFRVLRGASWLRAHSVNLESRFRNYASPQRRDDDFGFRCVLEEGEFR